MLSLSSHLVYLVLKLDKAGLRFCDKPGQRSLFFFFFFGDKPETQTRLTASKFGLSFEGSWFEVQLQGRVWVF